MTRAYHSPSSVKLGQRCLRAWAYRYIDGLRDPEVPWSEIEAGRIVEPRVRSPALGKAVHAVGEAYYSGGAPTWAGLPGQVFASGIHLLPPPSECRVIEVERAIGREPCTAAPAGVALSAHGLLWAGFRDLRVDTADGTLQVDYKTTSNISAWALDTAELSTDVQCALYTIDLCERLERDSVTSLWLYLETKRVRRALPVRATLSYSAALACLEPAAETARKLDTIKSSATAEQRSDACYAYGGCPYHCSVGGPCTAARSLHAKYEQLKGSHMSLDPALTAQFQALAPPPPPAPTGFGGQTTPAPAPTPAPTPAPAPIGFGHAPAEAPAPARRGRKPRAQAEPAPTAEAPAEREPTLLEQMAIEHTKLVEADVVRANALARIAEIVAELRAES